MSLILSGSDGLSDVDGSAATPAIRGTDTNTGIFFPAADTIAFSEGGAEAMRIDSSGNLGLGVTPSAWTSTYKAYQVGQLTSLSDSGSGNTQFACNWYNSASGEKYIANGFASMFRQVDGAFKFFTAASGTAGNAITFTQAMTLDANSMLTLNAIAGNNTNIALSQAGSVKWYIGNLDTSNAFRFYDNTAGAERARIDSSGNFLVGATSAVLSSRVLIAYNGLTNNGIVTNDTSSSGVTYSNVFIKNGSTVGGITQTTTATAYATSSDYRLKNSIAPMTGALAKVALLKPCTYKWNVDGSDGQGFIAHELAEVCPDAVTGEKDAVDEEGNPQYQGIDVSFLVATLTAAIQEQQAIIESQSVAIEALKARLDAANL